MTRAQEFVKRTFDVMVSATALVLLSPLLAAIAIAIRLDSHGETAVLFRQRRLGRNGSSFRLYKFRTMFEGAPDIRNADGSSFTLAHDSRVTRVGAFLRATSLDELPQLLNILAGHMSLVGPRPDLVDQAQYYSGDEWRRNLVRPGVTGWAQTSGRNSISWAARKQIDVEYVANQSLRLDLRILFRTIPCVLLTKHIHGSVPSVNTEQPNEVLAEPVSKSVMELAR
jgi:lipopolysaccharide/colanic/teichoic acid biosynthesis glycosyltransferase